MSFSPFTVLTPQGFRLFAGATLDSTNSEGLRRLEAGTARHFDVFVAEDQSAGRGRRGRAWHSPRGNLYLTLIVLPPRRAEIGQLAFVTALAVGDAIAPLVTGRADLRYKWPNDLLLDGRKLAGLLIEGSSATSGKEHGLAIGIGVNVAEVPSASAWPATALSENGVAAQPADLVEPILDGFAAWYDRWLTEGFAPVRAAWLERAFGVGDSIEARLPDGSIRRGMFRELDGRGALVIEAAGGGTSTVAAADVFFDSV